MPNTPLTIRVPINGKLLIKLDGFDTLHEVGSFTKELDVSVSTAGGNVDFQFDKKFWEESIEANRGVGAATPKAVASVVEDALRANDTVERVLRSTNAFITNQDVQKVAAAVVEALEKAGRLK